MKILEIIQQTSEWYKAKAGVPSTSNFDKIITTAGKPSKQADKYMLRLAGESILGTAEETYQNAAMLKGCEMEPEARKYYELVTGEKVEQIGFCTTDDGKIGCSPDGLVGKDGLLEIKCPLMTTQVERLINNKFPTTYFQQVQGQMYVTGRKWCDFLSYYEGLKPLLIRVERDEKFLSDLTVELKLFCENLQETINKIK